MPTVRILVSFPGRPPHVTRRRLVTDTLAGVVQALSRALERPVERVRFRVLHADGLPLIVAARVHDVPGEAFSDAGIDGRLPSQVAERRLRRAIRNTERRATLVLSSRPARSVERRLLNVCGHGLWMGPWAFRGALGQLSVIGGAR